jgi:DNA-binding CsgD family transcriptional regulator
MTGEAELLLAQIADPRPGSRPLPMAVYAVAARLRSIDRGAAAPETAPAVRVPSTAGGWLNVHASHLGGDIAVVVEAAHPHDIAPLLLHSYGLTPREHQVALLVLRGVSTQSIGDELYLSAYTVKDHLKSIFDKTGVRSRRELVARVLTER